MLYKIVIFYIQLSRYHMYIELHITCKR